MTRRPRTILLAVTAGLLLVPGVAHAQLAVDTNPGSSVRTRADLEGLLVSYEQALASTAYSNSVKDDIRARADRIRDRLTNGDFKLGDRVVLSVQGEPTLPDTVPVESGATGPMISLPLFGEISLAGVLRSEVQAHVAQALSGFIRDPVVRARGLMRISVVGAVARPGFYVVAADMLLSEALMVAGGPAPNADLENLRIDRGPTELIGGAPLQEELRLGRTLDQLNLQAGDQLTLPQDQPGSFFANVGVIVGLAASVTLIIIQIAR